MNAALASTTCSRVARAAFMHYDDKGHSMLKQHVALKWQKMYPYPQTPKFDHRENLFPLDTIIKDVDTYTDYIGVNNIFGNSTRIIT